MATDTIKTVLIDGGVPIALKGDESTRFIYNLLPVGRFYDKRYGEIYVSDELLRQMEANFGKYPAYKVPVKIGHGDGAPSPGEIIAIQAKPEGLEITMSVNKETSEAILKKQYRYMSAEFDENYIDKKTGNMVGAVLLGAALVNQPANPYMQPLKLADDIETKKENRSDTAMNETIELLKKQLSDAEAREKQAKEELAAHVEAQKNKDAEAQAKAKEAQAKAEETQKKIAELEAANKALNEEKEHIEAEKNEAEVKTFCDKWSKAGIPPAVLEKIKPLLHSKTGRIIHLSDDAKDDVPTMRFFDELFAGMPKVVMGQIGSADNPDTQLSDFEIERKRGEAIAASVSKNSKKEG